MALTINPPELHFNYTKFSGIIPNGTVVIDNFDPDFISYSVVQIPTWVTVQVLELDGEETYDGITFKVTVKPSVANNLPAGYYSGSVKIKFTIQLPLGVTASTTISYPLSINIVDNVPLTITPGSFSFNAESGGSNPPTQYCQIETDGNWSITPDETWLSFTSENGFGSELVGLNVDISGLSVGQHQASFLVDDGTAQKLGTVYLTITGTDSGGNLDVTPEALEFSETYQEDPQDERSFTVNSSEAATITCDVSWLDFSETSLDAGTNQVTVSTKNTQVIATGIYPATITITTANFIQEIYVTLYIQQKQTGGLKSNGFYFAKDRNKVSLSTNLSNREAEFNIKALATTGLKIYKRTIPFFRNLISFVFGLETEVHLKTNPVPDPLNTQIYCPLVPIIYNVDIYNKVIGSSPNRNERNYKTQFQNMQFINGTYPPKSLVNPNSKIPSVAGEPHPFSYKNKLTKIPSEITAPTDGVLMFSGRDTEFIPTVTMSVLYHPEGESIGPFNIYPSNSVAKGPLIVSYEVWTAIINLEPYEFPVGTKLSITAGLASCVLTIKESTHDTSYIIWENEWDCPECFNCTGPIEMTNIDGNTVSTKSIEGRDYEQVVEVLEPETFQVNTGNIYSQDEIKYLATMLRAKKIWLVVAGERYEVISNNRDIDTFQTRRFVDNITLKFKKATS